MSDSVRSRKRLPEITPALLMTTSGTPALARTFFAVAITLARSEISTTKGWAFTPRASISADTEARAFSFTSHNTTAVAPLVAAPRAINRPIPLAAPVTTTMLLEKEKMLAMFLVPSR